jgi:hypothetical protein
LPRIHKRGVGSPLDRLSGLRSSHKPFRDRLPVALKKSAHEGDEPSSFSTNRDLSERPPRVQTQQDDLASEASTRRTAPAASFEESQSPMNGLSGEKFVCSNIEGVVGTFVLAGMDIHDERRDRSGSCPMFCRIRHNSRAIAVTDTRPPCHLL